MGDFNAMLNAMDNQGGDTNWNGTNRILGVFASIGVATNSIQGNQIHLA